MDFKTDNERLKVLLYNAITLLVDEWYELYEDPDEFFNMICIELGTTRVELEKYGIDISIVGEE